MADENRKDNQIDQSYYSWLLRLWRVVAEGNTVWRASLEDPHTGKQRGFAGLDDLSSFLQGQTTESTESKERRQTGMPPCGERR
jgi:hypothetical protein